MYPNQYHYDEQYPQQGEIPPQIYQNQPVYQEQPVTIPIQPQYVHPHPQQTYQPPIHRQQYVQPQRIILLIDEPPRKRNDFIIKVYLTVICQLLLSTIVGIATYTNDDIQDFVTDNPALIFVAFIIAIIMIFVTYKLHDTQPWNIVCLVLFTFSMSYILGVAILAYAPEIIFQALIMTTFITISLTVFTWVNRDKDFSGMRNILFGSLIILIFIGIFQIFFTFSTLAQTIISGIGALVFMGYIVYDSWLIFTKYHENQWVLASISLYLDIINLFLRLLRLLNNLQRN